MIGMCDADVRSTKEPMRWGGETMMLSQGHQMKAENRKQTVQARGKDDYSNVKICRVCGLLDETWRFLYFCFFSGPNLRNSAARRKRSVRSSFIRERAAGAGSRVSRMC